MMKEKVGKLPFQFFVTLSFFVGLYIASGYFSFMTAPLSKDVMVSFPDDFVAIDSTTHLRSIVCKPRTRYVRLTNSPSGGYLQASEIEIIGQDLKTNIARGKTCSSSGVYENSPSQFGCGQLLDGSRAGSFFHSAGNGLGEFVEIDLGSDFDLTSVTVFNRDDTTFSRLQGQHLLLLDASRRSLAAFSLRGVREPQTFDVGSLACPGHFATKTATQSPEKSFSPSTMASLSTGASPQPHIDSSVFKRWAEFRRCVGIAQSPCAIDTASELPLAPLSYAELEAHYYHMLNVTAPMRGMKPHTWAGYAGPWIENEFIAWGQRLNFSVFHLFYPLVPLFVQTVDACLIECCAEMMVYDGGQDATYSKALLDLIRNGLRRDVIYLMVLQADAGLCFLPREEDCVARNILALSSGGWGNVALPLIKGFIAPDDFGGLSAPDTGKASFYSRAVLISSTASDTNSLRAVIRSRLSADLPGEKQFRQYNGGPEWKGVVHDSVLSLSPRGVGRSSYRMSELAQMGIPQIYIYDDVPWAPYWDPSAPDGRPGREDVWGPNGIGFISSLDGLHDITSSLCDAMTLSSSSSKHSCVVGVLPSGPPFVVQRGSRVDRMAARALQLAHSHFTYGGLILRILEYIAVPWDADLVCIPRPRART